LKILFKLLLGRIYTNIFGDCSPGALSWAYTAVPPVLKIKKQKSCFDNFSILRLRQLPRYPAQLRAGPDRLVKPGDKDIGVKTVIWSK
jgi:hypothetical protein